MHLTPAGPCCETANFEMGTMAWDILITRFRGTVGTAFWTTVGTAFWTTVGTAFWTIVGTAFWTIVGTAFRTILGTGFRAILGTAFFSVDVRKITRFGNRVSDHFGNTILAILQFHFLQKYQKLKREKPYFGSTFFDILLTPF